jgi:hypothetical protein|tara:strand:- start:2425 stop:2700 length:276 start_codon:yes stop_codon:yes gene_type:complete
MNYKKLKNCSKFDYIKEGYNPVTLSYSDYQNYLIYGNNAIDASGGVKIGKSAPGVILGHVRQNPTTANRLVSNKHFWSGIPNNTPGLSWIN